MDAKEKVSISITKPIQFVPVPRRIVETHWKIEPPNGIKTVA